ncbi:MAG: 1,4-alpha-glucan branching protein GlgB [Nitrospirae bacterium]|nr:1,4-alpha-glucan branching protein GlgB [Candidatus Troglogloeales bacterium]
MPMTKEQKQNKKVSQKAAVSLFTEYDIYLFREGNHSLLYEKFGSHYMTVDKQEGTYFAVWAPNARRVSVIGDFNGWNEASDPLDLRRDGSGIWEGFVPNSCPGTRYKYHIVSQHNHYAVDKGDPFAILWETPPKTGSVVWDIKYEWGDDDWMANRHRRSRLHSPYSIYEVHLGSWRRVPEENSRPLTYRELADILPAYVREVGFTHVELLPIMEHPFYGSWGYQTVGYFAPTSRYGTPEDFMALIDALHQQGVGVILDWVPSHFPSDEHGLAFFDGTYLFEHADSRKGFHPDWKSCIFNYGRNEVRAFLMSSALFWLERYHIDSLRLDAVASMLYLDYGRSKGEWIPNEYGGRENIEAMVFLKRLNVTVYEKFPDVQTIAEESTAWPMVSRPTYLGGLGFGMKWMMGWMHDTLAYFAQDPVYRKFHHNQLAFSIIYAFSENFVLPLSHDEVVYGKGSLIGKMHGDVWQQFAHLRLLYGYMFGHPGKKLLFMGGEFGQVSEWRHDEGLQWHLLQYPFHQGIKQWVTDLNRLYQLEPALHRLDFSSDGFEWITHSDWEQSVLSFIRKGMPTDPVILVVANFTPVPRYNYRVGVPQDGIWKEALNSDARLYEGGGCGNMGSVTAVSIPSHGQPHSLCLTLPPLGVLFLKSNGL